MKSRQELNEKIQNSVKTLEKCVEETKQVLNQPFGYFSFACTLVLTALKSRKDKKAFKTAIVLAYLALTDASKQEIFTSFAKTKHLKKR